MKRYEFLTERDIFEALNKLRDAFLAAKDGNEVEKIINGFLTHDEKLRLGRRILIADALSSQMTFEEIAQILKVGRNNILNVSQMLDRDNTWHTLITKHTKQKENIYDAKKYIKSGGSKLVYKKKEYSGFTRKEVKRK